ncbi:MAG: Spx/MgsR family RNA polymerase-binding regulatory protein [Burkholderiaceae bacterium]|jgi:arsenate reductase (glutaredoxin)|nr:Spx/MgsR family RNA polymerase-binding regulatory protein [Burkholderiaceae bacterium]
MSTPRIHGIPNCDQVRQARRWLIAHQVGFEFVDIRSAPPLRDQLLAWLKHIPHDSLLNRRGLTWRRLPETVRQGVVDQTSALELMLEHPLLLKRPILEWDEQLAVGFSEPLYESILLCRPSTPEPLPSPES